MLTRLCCLMTLTGLLGGLQAATLKSPDGLALELSARGRVTAVSVGRAKLPLRGDGGFALADFRHQPEPVNLVPNAGFEQGVEGWRLGQGQSLETAVAHGGKACARLEVPGPEPASNNLEVIVPVKPNTRYRVGMWLRRHGVGVCGVYSSERDDANKLTGKQGQIGTAIPRADDQWLPLSWELLTEPATTRLSLRGDIYRSTGTLWLDDFFVTEISDQVYEPVSGTVRSSAGGLSFSGGLAARGLTVEATLKPQGECLRVDGVLRDTTGEERAVGLRFVLPVDLTGWAWYDEPQEARTIAAGQPSYRYTYNCVSGTGKCSVYPWSAVCGSDAALSLALPLSAGPRTFLLEYLPGGEAPASAGLALSFCYGLSKAATHHPSSAPFSFVLYAPEARWGLRSAMERYYRLFPEAFVKRPTFEGYLNYANLERFDPKTHDLVVANHPLPDASDWGEGYKFLFHVHGCYDFRQVPYPDPVRPDDKTVFGLLEAMVQKEQGAKHVSYVPTSETVRKICYGPQDEVLYIGDTQWWRAQEGYNHTDQPGWGLNFRVNEDPEVSPFLQDKSKQVALDYAKTEHRPWDGTFTADAIEGYMSNTTALDYRPEHLRASDAPLTFGKDSLRPALVNTIWDFLDKAWKPITDEHKIATYGNANGYEQAFALPYVDVPMTEGSWDAQHPGRLDRYLRGMAHHKLWRYWHAWDATGGYGDKDPDNVRLQLQRCLQYAIYPPVYCVEAATADLEAWRGEYRQYVPAIEELSAAGWEPVPYAAATGGVVVERYGSFADGRLHFTLRNEGDKTVETTLTLDGKGLGMPAGSSLLVQDILPGMPRFDPLAAGGYVTTLQAGEARALWIGTRLQAAQNGYRLAAAVLEKAERMYRDEARVGAEGWAALQACAREGVSAPASKALRPNLVLSLMINELDQNFPEGWPPVDLNKLLFRVLTYSSYAPVALLDLDVQAPRLVRDVAPGTVVEVPCSVRPRAASSRVKVSDGEEGMPISSPWEDVAEKSTRTATTAKLFVPVGPARRLLPYVIYCEVATEAAGGPVALLTLPIDVVVGASVAADIQPARVFRGQDRKLVLTLNNRLPEAAEVKLALTPPAKTRLDVTEKALQLPASGSLQVPLTMSLQPTAFLGGTRLGYALTSGDPRFVTRGTVELTVSDPVPQLAVRRVASAPRIDGKLEETVWQGEPTIPALNLLRSGAAATEPTAVWVAYDDRGLYVAFRCSESQMDKLAAKYTTRGEPLYLDDDVELFIFAPRGKQVYQLAVNALGTQSDNFGNKADWQAAAAREGRQWTVEVFVPYAAVGASGPPAAGLAWGMQFGRQQKAKGETTSWTKGPAFIAKEGFGEIVFE